MGEPGRCRHCGGVARPGWCSSFYTLAENDLVLQYWGRNSPYDSAVDRRLCGALCQVQDDRWATVSVRAAD